MFEVNPARLWKFCPKHWIHHSEYFGSIFENPIKCSVGFNMTLFKNHKWSKQQFPRLSQNFVRKLKKTACVL